AYAGAHRFGVEIFDPATSNTLMAAVLVHDLYAGEPAHAEPWQDEAHGAAHGGLWTSAYQPRSALGLAAGLGLGALRPYRPSGTYSPPSGTYSRPSGTYFPPFRHRFTHVRYKLTDRREYLTDRREQLTDRREYLTDRR